MDNETKNYVDAAVTESTKYNTPKYGDTPTDNLQLVPKKYVSSVVSSLVGAINAVASFSGVTSPGGANKQIQYNNSGGFGGDPALTWSGSILTVGQSGSVIGNVQIAGATSGTVQVQTASNAGNWVMTVPSNAGSSNQVLTTDGNGITRWASVASGGSPAGSNTRLQFNDSGSFGGAADLQWDKTGHSFTFGNGVVVGNASNQNIVGVNSTSSIGGSINLQMGSGPSENYQGNVYIKPGNGTSLTNSATAGFLYIPTMNGAPTQPPRDGDTAMVFDVSNNKLWVYNSGWVGITLF